VHLEYNAPAIGRAAVAVLERNGVDVSLPASAAAACRTSTAAPSRSAGRSCATTSARWRRPCARAAEIVSPGPTCSYMLKREYPWLDGSEDATLVATHTRDLFEYLAQLHADGRSHDVQPSGRPVTYHVPCHLRAQNIGTRSADILRTIPGPRSTSSSAARRWMALGLQDAVLRLSMKVAQPLFDAVRARRRPRATDCPLPRCRSAGTGVEAAASDPGPGPAYAWKDA